MLGLINSFETYDILIILLSSLITAALTAFAWLLLKEKKAAGKLPDKKRRRSFLIKSYLVFSDFILTKRYVEQMRKRYELLCPEAPKSLMCRAMAASYLVWCVSILAFLFIFGLHPAFYTAYLALLSMIVFNHELIEYSAGNLEMKLMNQFDKFLSDTRHSFYRHGMIDEAIADASEMCGHVMKANAVKILNVLDSNDREGAIRLYNETVSNRFLRMFLSAAVYVSEFGDKIVREASVFLCNINTLKNDLYIEMMNTKETHYRFSGMIFTALAPVYLLDAIESWSKDITPDMAEFYHGAFGIAVRISIYLLTVIMYLMINELKDRKSFAAKEHYLIKRIAGMYFFHKMLNNYEEKFKYGLERTEDLLYRVGETLTARQFFLKRVLYGAVLFLMYVIISLYVHGNNRITLLSSERLITNKVNIISDKYMEAAAETVLAYVNLYKNQKVERTRLEDELQKEGTFRSEVIRTAVAEEIMTRLAGYNKEYFHWYELLFAVFAAGIAYWLPYWMLLYRKRVLYLNMDNEVSQFHSTILMVMHLDNMTVLRVLELMESFAVIFRASLKNCINDYSAGDLDALEKLKLRERYDPFCRLVDNLIIADKIGIQRAFDEVEEERKVSREMRNQDYRITRDKKVICGLVMSFVPAAITVGLYWIIPFAMNALGDLADYDAIMQNLK